METTDDKGQSSDDRVSPTGFSCQQLASSVGEPACRPGRADPQRSHQFSYLDPRHLH